MILYWLAATSSLEFAWIFAKPHVNHGDSALSSDLKTAFIVMSFPFLQPEQNLRNFFVTNLQQIYRDLEGFPQVEATKIDHALYRLEHVAIVASQCHGV